ncbi:hypothetical protein ACSSS7_002354 [Eimeria intestinalis]
MAPVGGSRGSDQQGKKINLWGRTQHPAIERAFSIAYAYFHQLLVEQDLFFGGGGEQADKLLEYLPTTTSSSSSSNSGSSGYKGRDAAAARNAIELGWLRGEVSSLIKELKTERETNGNPNKKPNRSVLLFERICSLSGCPTPAAAAAAAAAAAGGKAAAAAADKAGLEAVPNFIKEIVLAIAYPRLDINGLGSGGLGLRVLLLVDHQNKPQRQGHRALAEVAILHPSRHRQVFVLFAAAAAAAAGRVCVPIDLSQ